MKFSLDRTRADAVGRNEALEELRKAAAFLGNRRFSRHEFDKIAKRCKGSTVIKLFGGWNLALAALGVALRPHTVDRKQISDAELLNELARIWQSLGHRPSKMEWDASDACYSYTTYKQRFGGWINACAALVTRIDPTVVADAKTATLEQPGSLPARIQKRTAAEEKRNVPLKLRLRILSRDRFRCVLCGRTPALDAGAVLHIDHINPYAKGGQTAEGNLRTLCERCNWGKGVDHGTS